MCLLCGDKLLEAKRALTHYIQTLSPFTVSPIWRPIRVEGLREHSSATSDRKAYPRSMSKRRSRASVAGSQET
jgi:hypothetical protein